MTVLLTCGRAPANAGLPNVRKSIVQITAPLRPLPRNPVDRSDCRSGNLRPRRRAGLATPPLVSVGGFAAGLLRHPEYRLTDGIIAHDFLDLGVGVQPRPQ